MEIRIIGSGTMGSITRGNQSIMVDDILFDIGSGVVKKIESLGIRDQQRSEECWLYTIVQIILYANSRILGRKFVATEPVADKSFCLIAKDGE